ncbi:BREX-3 system phosphatase PglZ [Rubinisphaera brasiliensis]|uniref:PglZ domain protein n=1 Tax=Rubinisphaera brasiliensis (strain ATCC 49424 / DSM 5305 / JCM 21570 / IAM 15109 / NBRC 103401 / IFAM 1448) TaxID=756272 RepID=F0SKT4_RUBBR|nr:BREX-3 system phosphatase PglZ [Rubinisphaera brasiliensis]ADY58754.1 PglZ domain protein [Rubinisphaera brasiliensis DSM 5305]
MADWRDSILKEFKRDISRLTLVSDPDGLLTEERTLATIKERGFDLIPFEDSIAFRYAYESKYRTIWDEGKKTDLVVVLRSEGDLESLPSDLYHAGRPLEFSLHKLFPNLNYPVLRALDSSHLDALFEAYQQQQGSVLAENGTKEFILTHCFRIVPRLISTPVALLKELLSMHSRGASIPDMLIDHLLSSLEGKSEFKDWPLREIVSNREALHRFLQEQWPVYLKSLTGGPAGLVPFDHQDVRAYVDTLFLEGQLKPVAVKDSESLPTWAQIGVKHDPQADALKRLKGLIDLCEKSLPSTDAPHKDWQKFARTWAESVVLRWQLDASVSSTDQQSWSDLHESIEDRFAEWMLSRFASLHSLPYRPEPVMVHRIPDYLAWVRAENNLSKVALVVADGLALDQWLLLRRCLDEKQVSWRFVEETAIFAWVPTLTSVSRQSIFSGLIPHLYSDSLYDTSREPKHWEKFWEDEGVSRDAIEYAKMVESGQSENLDLCLQNPHLNVLGIVVNTVDKIMHGEHQGTVGMHDAILRWADDAISVVDRLLDEGFEVFLTADHGNVAAAGMGLPREGVLVEVGGKRARIYESANVREEAKSEYPESIEWPNIGLPPECHVLLPKGLRAFTPEGKRVVSHGGIALEEVVVPFVWIAKDEV